MKEYSGNKRVILITGDKTKWYEQAIFIVKKNIQQTDVPLNFIDEAEKIVENYMIGNNILLNQTGYTKAEYAMANSNINKIVKNKAKKPKRKSSFDFMLNIAMILGCSVIAGILLYSILS